MRDFLHTEPFARFASRVPATVTRTSIELEPGLSLHAHKALMLDLFYQRIDALPRWLADEMLSRELHPEEYELTAAGLRMLRWVEGLS